MEVVFQAEAAAEALVEALDSKNEHVKAWAASELGKLKPGEPITADLIVQDESAWLENIVIANPPATEKK